MDKSLWCLYSIVSRMASEKRAEVIMLGQLADELFGGYAKYQARLKNEGKKAAAAMMDQDVRNYIGIGVRRDADACSRWLEPRFPFMEKEVVDLGKTIPITYKVMGGVRKAVLREAAVSLGVPEDLRGMAKKAAQYSSGIQKLVD